MAAGISRRPIRGSDVNDTAAAADRGCRSTGAAGDGGHAADADIYGIGAIAIIFADAVVQVRDGANAALLRTVFASLGFMIGLPAGTRIWIAAGFTDMRCGFNGLYCFRFSRWDMANLFKNAVHVTQCLEFLSTPSPAGKSQLRHESVQRVFRAGSERLFSVRIPTRRQPTSQDARVKQCFSDPLQHLR